MSDITIFILFITLGLSMILFGVSLGLSFYLGHNLKIHKTWAITTILTTCVVLSLWTIIYNDGCMKVDGFVHAGVVALQIFTSVCIVVFISWIALNVSKDA